MKTGDDAGPAPTYVTESDEPLGGDGGPVFDVVVCGGTLGIFLATALQMRCGVFFSLLFPVQSSELALSSSFPRSPHLGEGGVVCDIINDDGGGGRGHGTRTSPFSLRC